MLALPRLAVGALQAQADRQPLVWGLLEALTRIDWQLRLFRSQASFSPLDAARRTLGAAPRHLDSWLMSPEVCREVLAHGAAGADLCLIDGEFFATGPGGQLDALCDWLDVPRIGIVDLRRLADCRLPARPRKLDALLFDGAANEAEYFAWRTTLGALWNLPVLGGLIVTPGVREALARVEPGAEPPDDVREALGDGLQSTLAVNALETLAGSRSFPPARPRLFAARASRRSLRVAVAYDDAFHCYFPDALDLLEVSGATLVDFSPLTDEDLPSDVDLVVLGCGRPDRHAQALADNHCMAAALRRHVCEGRRVYAEAGGAAYLCQNLVTADGRTYPMAGVFQATAHARPTPSPAEAVELRMPGCCWLAPRGATVRGYANGMWRFEADESSDPACLRETRTADFLCRGRALGSRLHLNFVAQPELFARLLEPLDVRGMLPV